MNTMNFRDQFVRSVDFLAMDLSTNKIGVTTDTGIASFDPETGGISVNPLSELAVKLPGIAVRTPLTDLKAGDVVVMGDKTPAFFHKDNTLVRPDGTVQTFNAVTNTLLGAGVLAVRNFFTATESGFNPMLLMALAEDDIDPLMLMMLMGQGGAKPDMNMMMMLMLMGKGKSGPFARSR